MAFIYKDGTYYNRSGGDGASLPSGGTTGQSLVKKSNTDQDVEWSDVDGLPSGGTQGQVLTKQSSTDGDAGWETPTEYTAGDGINIDENGEISTDNMPAEDMAEVASPMPSVMSRRFKYSTEEQVIGEWIDGKPIYQKVVVFQNEITVTTSWTNLGIDIENLDKIIYCAGNKGSALYPLNADYDIAIPTLQAMSCRASGADVIKQLILQYTKTTD